MRRYAEGEPVGELLASFADTVENFYKQFYGITNAPIITENNMAILNKCLEQQREIGSKTKGSIIEFIGRNPHRE